MKKLAYHPSGELIIEFDESDHSYIDNFDRRYTSVTTIIGDHFPKFNAKTMATKCSKKVGGKYHGMKPGEILDMWQAEAERGRDEGTNVHEYAEWLISGKTQGRPTRPISERCERLFVQAEKAVAGLLKRFTFIAAEMIVFSPGTGLAGMIDLLMYDPLKNEIIILDWKQNKEIVTDTMYDKTGLPPIEHLDDTDFNHYGLQLSTYQYIMECNGYFPGKTYRRALIHLRENSFVSIPLPYFKTECMSIAVKRGRWELNHG